MTDVNNMLQLYNWDFKNIENGKCSKGDLDYKYYTSSGESISILISFLETFENDGHYKCVHCRSRLIILDISCCVNFPQNIDKEPYFGENCGNLFEKELVKYPICNKIYTHLEGKNFSKDEQNIFFAIILKNEKKVGEEFDAIVEKINRYYETSVQIYKLIQELDRLYTSTISKEHVFWKNMIRTFEDNNILIETKKNELKRAIESTYKHVIFHAEAIKQFNNNENNTQILWFLSQTHANVDSNLLFARETNVYKQGNTSLKDIVNFYSDKISKVIKSLTAVKTPGISDLNVFRKDIYDVWKIIEALNIQSYKFHEIQIYAQSNISDQQMKEIQFLCTCHPLLGDIHTLLCQHITNADEQQESKEEFDAKVLSLILIIASFVDSKTPVLL